MTPTAPWTACASASRVAVGVAAGRHVPVHIIGAPSSLCRWWMDVRLARARAAGRQGGRGRPAPRAAARSSCRSSPRPSRSRARRRGSRGRGRAALAGAHRHGRVALRELDRVEALGDRPLEVLVGDVLADADEALVLAGGAVVGRGGNRPAIPSPVTEPTASTPSGSSVGTKMPAARVVLDARTGLREQGVGRLAAAGHDEQVAASARPSSSTPRSPALAAACARSRGCAHGAGRRRRRSRRPARLAGVGGLARTRRP